MEEVEHQQQAVMEEPQIPVHHFKVEILFPQMALTRVLVVADIMAAAAVQIMEIVVELEVAVVDMLIQ